MPSETVVFAILFLTALTDESATYCNVRTDGIPFEKLCNYYADTYCFVSISADKEHKIIQECGGEVPGNRMHEVNTWIKSGGNYTFLCDTINMCNRLSTNDKIRLTEVTAGKLVCQLNKKANDDIIESYNDFWTLRKCYDDSNYKCAYTKNLKTNERRQDCMKFSDKELLDMNKCVKTETKYQYICNTPLCNNAHVCDQLELGKPSPFDIVTFVPAPDSGAGQGPTVPTPKNTGSCFNLPTIVMSVLVVVICFSV
uniref:Secreted protein n=1 Tax=Panagrellus redivivus TaxID=6233 RepID=A0A7E4ZRH0_PANRE